MIPHRIIKTAAIGMLSAAGLSSAGISAAYAQKDAPIDAAASSPETAAENAPAQTPDWLATVQLSKRGSHIIGRPDASLKITEFVSYTCGHCSDFERDGVPKIKADFVASGKANFEIRNLILNPVDMTVAILARCGPTKGFFVRHKFWLKTQTDWVLRARGFSKKTLELYKQREKKGIENSLMRAIYDDMRLSEQAAKIGLADATAKKCLADKDVTAQIKAMRKEGFDELGVKGTPSFLINGKLADGVHRYEALEPLLTEETGI